MNETIQVPTDGNPEEVVTCNGMVCKCTHKLGQCLNCNFISSCNIK